MKKNFILIGAAGYIAPRHMKAIKYVNGNLIAILDPNDSVGIIDKYFPKAKYFSSFERFDRFINKFILAENKIHFTSICSPNYLHDFHVRFGLRINSHVICEKPLVLNPWNFNSLYKLQSKSKNKVFNILQLRLHPELINLKNQIKKSKKKLYKVDLTYITPRGDWYDNSWKGDISKSGGIVVNIGIHLFDILIWLFGKYKLSNVHLLEKDCSSGFLQFKNADIRWFLSTKSKYLKKNKKPVRIISIDNKIIDFSNSFESLHIDSYKKIIEGNGFEISEVSDSIKLCYDLRNSKIATAKKNLHPLNNF